MSEYIVEIPEEPAKIVRDGWNVRVDWQYKQREEIVRCKDCKYYKEKVYKCVNNLTLTEKTCEGFDGCHVEPNGFCAWGERRDLWTTCKCGEEIELGDRESAVCPSCGRMVRE